MSAGRFQQLLVVASSLLLGVLESKPMRAQIKRGTTPEDYFTFQFFGDPQLSPDGNAVAYVLTTVDQKKPARLFDLAGDDPWFNLPDAQ